MGKTHEQAIHRKSPNGKNQNQKPNLIKVKWKYEKVLSFFVESEDMHIKIQILHIHQTGKNLESDTTKCWQEYGVKWVYTLLMGI